VLRKTTPHEQASRVWDSDIPSRLVALYLAETDPEEQWGHQDLSGFLLTRCGVSRSPIAQGLVLSNNGDVYATGSGQSAMEKVAPGGGASVTKARCIGGRAYTVGLGRDVYRRVDVGRWERLADGLPVLDPGTLNAGAMLELGFEDIDGFGEDDIYAVGGHRDVWHYDGRAWKSCRFADDWPLFRVCCAGDGQVYISGEGGRLYRGRGDDWKRVWDSELSVPYNDAVWFQDKLWLAGDYAFDQWTGREMVPVHHDGKRVNARGHMDVGDGVLMIAEHDTVRLFDGERWRDIVAPY
jgi:hypothetical protein